MRLMGGVSGGMERRCEELVGGQVRGIRWCRGLRSGMDGEM